MGRAKHPCLAAADQGWSALPTIGSSGWRLATGRDKKPKGDRKPERMLRAFVRRRANHGRGTIHRALLIKV